MQVQGTGHGTYRYDSFWHALTTIVKADGLAGLYRGFGPTMFREIPFSSLQFAVYGVCTRALEPRGNSKVKINILSNAY